jgi:hypothetical protein
VPAWKLRQNSSFRHLLGLFVSVISLGFLGYFSIIESVRLAKDDTLHILLFISLGVILSLAFSVIAYAAVRFAGWVALNFITVCLWRNKIKRNRN